MTSGLHLSTSDYNNSIINFDQNTVLAQYSSLPEISTQTFQLEIQPGEGHTQIDVLNFQQYQSQVMQQGDIQNQNKTTDLAIQPSQKWISVFESFENLESENDLGDELRKTPKTKIVWTPQKSDSPWKDGKGDRSLNSNKREPLSLDKKRGTPREVQKIECSSTQKLMPKSLKRNVQPNEKSRKLRQDEIEKLKSKGEKWTSVRQGAPSDLKRRDGDSENKPRDVKPKDEKQTSLLQSAPSDLKKRDGDSKFKPREIKQKILHKSAPIESKKRNAKKLISVGEDQYFKVGKGSKLIRYSEQDRNNQTSHEKRGEKRLARDGDDSSVNSSKKQQKTSNNHNHTDHHCHHDRRYNYNHHNRQLCMHFCKFGECQYRDEGTCRLRHDMQKVQICFRWLNGNCSDPKCKQQHAIVKDLLPLCLHFLQGKCSRENCPFLHIYLGSCVKPCKDFLAGYCAKGSECTQLHLTKKQLEKYQLLNASRDKTIDKINNRIINKHSVPTQIDEISFLPSFLK
eukprot:TRINITY_DN6859_c0_g1_i1.p1 TRINITY_DN6859_c0_g1~~TRINITY_DN6859_c0_g1_i1.p1  ORF type:complete len:511 (-),score=29.61 TRINITY_DN6859_c0_g1_i1:314-1846(-)